MDQALSNLRVPRAACKLMRFYSARSEGFRPSLKMINEATNVGEKNISTIRALLVKRGLVGYDGRNVYIDWCRIRAFASLNPRMMGQRKHWVISEMDLELLGEPKTQVHTYIGTGNQYSKYLYCLYEATAEAVQDGVTFPELRGTEAEKLLGRPKTQVHTYIGIDNLVFGANGLESMGWYNPFDEPDPDWAADMPGNDALPF